MTSRKTGRTTATGPSSSPAAFAGHSPPRHPPPKLVPQNSPPPGDHAPPRDQPSPQNVTKELDHMVLINELHMQIEELKASFSSAEEERKKLKEEIKYYATAATETMNNTVQKITAATATTFATGYPAVDADTAATIINNANTNGARSTATVSSAAALYTSEAYTASSAADTSIPRVSVLRSESLPSSLSYHNGSNLPGMYHHFTTASTTEPHYSNNFPPTLPVRLPATSSLTPLNPTINYSPVRKCQELPEFSGKPEEWPMFIVAFKETSAAHGYTDLENLSRLQRALKGDAKFKVEALLIHPNSVRAIIETLEFHYGRPEILIRSQLAKVRSFPNILETKLNQIVNYSVMVSNLTVFLENVSASSHLSNPTLLDELVMKLPFNKREEWARHTISLLPLHPSIRDFNTWLKGIATYVAIATDISTNSASTNKNTKNTNIVCAFTERKSNCAACEKDHPLYQCSKFKDLSVDDRWKVVKANHICFCCLRQGHAIAKCSLRRTCGIAACRKSHNRLLHGSTETNFATKQKQTGATTIGNVQVAENLQTNDAVVSAIGHEGRTDNTLFKFLPVRVSGPLGSCVVIAFIDEGAKVSLIEESVARRVGVKGSSDLLSLRWISNRTTTENSQHVDVEISGVYHNAIKHQMKDIRTTKNLFLPAQTLRFKEFQKEYTELGKILVDDYVNAVPQILIGIPHTNLVRPINILNFGKGFAVHNTKLGWTLFGSNENNESEAVVNCIIPTKNELEDLHNQVAEYFTLESLECQPRKQIISENDKRAETILKTTTKKICNQYETGLLWKSDSIQFSESYSMALKRLVSVENKMFKNAKFGEWYNSKISEYIKKNYARKLSQNEFDETPDRVWYLPHFAVCNVNKDNKMRLVFDAAAEANGMSLNSRLLKGPSTYQPKSLLTILLCFRQRRVGVCADIREMFLRVNIIKKDQNAQRFLWREGDRSRTPDTYVMTAMIFGSKSSPCSAQYIKNVNASQYINVYPRAVKAIIDCHYVDDYVDSFDTVEEAIEVARNVKQIHSEAGFEIRDFVSNSTDFLQTINNMSATTDLTSVCRNGSTNEKILGMYWNPSTDMFCFVLNFRRMPQAILDGLVRPTKSQVLSITMSIFDPFGFLANVTILPKLLLQKLWKTNMGWNELIPEDIYSKWYTWYKQLDNVKHLEVPRCYHPDITYLDSEIQVHIFVDASELAIAAVGYWRVNFNNEVSISFIMGKTKCSPLKALSILRLELQAAVLGVRLKEAIINSHDFKPSKVTFVSNK